MVVLSPFVFTMIDQIVIGTSAFITARCNVGSTTIHLPYINVALGISIQPSASQNSYFMTINNQPPPGTLAL